MVDKDLDCIYDFSDIVFSAGYHYKVPSELLLKPYLGTINIHQSYRMKYKGRNMNTHVLRNGDEVHGTTLHYMTDVIDNGDIVDTDCFLVENTDTAFSLNEKCMKMAITLLERNVSKLLSGHEIAKHTHHPDSVRYIKSDIDHHVRYSLDEVSFDRNVRSLTFPGTPKPYTVVNGNKIKLCYEN